MSEPYLRRGIDGMYIFGFQCVYILCQLPLSRFVADLSRSSTVYTSLGVKLRRRKTVFAETHGSMIANEPLMEANN
jgi:hypothetical protein